MAIFILASFWVGFETDKLLAVFYELLSLEFFLNVDNVDVCENFICLTAGTRINLGGHIFCLE